MFEDKIHTLRILTEGKLSETEAKHLIVETMYLRPGNIGKKWPGLYGPFRFWFEQDKHRKIRMYWDPNATNEAIQVWDQVASTLYGNRYISRSS